MVYAMIFFPIVMAAIAFALPPRSPSSARWRPWLIPLTAAVYLAMTARALAAPTTAFAYGWLALDAPGKLVLLIVGVLYFLCSFHAVGYLRWRPERSNRVFCACMLILPGLFSLVIWSHQPGVMWVGIEAISLTVCPLIYFERTRSSLD